MPTAASLSPSAGLHGNYYRATVRERKIRPLSGDASARVCIVGGGFAGLNTALGLAERGQSDVILLEAEEIGFGASGRNGGFVFGGFSLGEDALLSELGGERARLLYRGTSDAVELIRRRIIRYGIACDYVPAGVIWANWFRDPQVLRSRQKLLAEEYGVLWRWLPQARLKRRIHTRQYHDGLFEPKAFHFHPLKYAYGLGEAAESLGVTIHEATPAIALTRDGNGWVIRTSAGTVSAEHVVLACGGYLAGLRGEVDRSVLPISTYVMTTEPLGSRMGEVLSTRSAVYDTRFAFDYYRPLPDTRLLWGGRISILERSPEAVARVLRRDMLRVFPQLEDARIDHAWSGLMSYARHQMPQLGAIEAGLWMAQAFGGHGVAPTTMAGEFLAAAIAEGDRRWQLLQNYGLVPAYKPAGMLAAQLSYWWAESRDAGKAWRERVLEVIG